MTYTAFEFFTTDEAVRNLLMAVLADNGFESFEERDHSVVAYIPKSFAERIRVIELLHEYQLEDVRFDMNDIPQQNWNAEWEKNFKPVIIADRVGIRASFHKAQSVDFDLIIDPKMSFGTGHHHTTMLMITAMLALDFRGKNVLDFGSGTGVLAVLAEKLGAEKIMALDNEEWAYENCRENLLLNNCKRIQAMLGDDSIEWDTTFAIILANVNRTTILRNLTKWRDCMQADGVLLLSGLLVADEIDIQEAARTAGFTHQHTLRQEGWLAIQFISKKK